MNNKLRTLKQLASRADYDTNDIKITNTITTNIKSAHIKQLT